MSNRRFSHPNYQLSQPGHYYYDDDAIGPTDNQIFGGSFDEQDPMPDGYGNLEHATLRSEISMSVITDDTRLLFNEAKHVYIFKWKAKIIDKLPQKLFNSHNYRKLVL